MRLHTLAWCALALVLSAAPGITGCGRSADTGAPAPTSQPAVASATGPATASQPALSTATAPGEVPAVSQSDLRDLAAKLGADLLACNEITRNPFRITIVMKDLANKTEDMPGRDMSIYVAKLTSLLNTGATADRLLFVEQQAALRNMQAGEAGGAPAAAPRMVPQFALYGEVHSMINGPVTYYLFTFRLTNLTTGAQAWNGSYEIRTLN